MPRIPLHEPGQTHSAPHNPPLEARGWRDYLQSMTERDRVLAAMRGLAVDRPPISFWGHVYHRESSAAELAEHTFEHRASAILRETLPAPLAAAARLGRKHETLDEAIRRAERSPAMTRSEAALRALKQLEVAP